MTFLPQYQPKLAFFACLWCLSAQAQDSQSIKLGEADIVPTVRIDYVTNSNAFLTNSGIVSATGVSVSPSVLLKADKRLLDVSFGYQGQYASMSEDALSFDDHRLFGILDVEIDSRRRANVTLEIAKDHEELGTGRTFGTASSDSDAVEYLEAGIDGNYTFGALSAKGNLTGGLLFSNRSYQNRNDLTTGADVTELTPYGQFSYRLSGTTRGLLELRLRSLNLDANSADRTELQALVGLKFLGSSKTKGDVKLGVGNANYSDEAVADTSFGVVDASISYLPTSFANITFDYSRQLDDSDRVEVTQVQPQTIEDALQLSWKHQWSSFVSSYAYIRADISSRDCPTSSTQTATSGLEIQVNPRRWVSFGVGAANEARDVSACIAGSDTSALEYERQLINVFVRMSL